MLHTIKQLKGVFEMMIFNNFHRWGWNSHDPADIFGNSSNESQDKTKEEKAKEIISTLERSNAELTDNLKSKMKSFLEEIAIKWEDKESIWDKWENLTDVEKQAYESIKRYLNIRNVLKAEKIEWEKMLSNQTSESLVALASLIQSIDNLEKETRLELKDVDLEEQWFQDEKREDVDNYNFENFLKSLSSDLKDRHYFKVKVIEEHNIPWWAFTHHIGDKIDWKPIVKIKKTRKWPIFITEQEVTITRENIKENIKDRKVMSAILDKYGYEDERSIWTKLSTLAIGDSQEQESLDNRLSNLERLKAAQKETPEKYLESLKSILFNFDSDSTLETSLRDNVTEVSIFDYVESIQDLKNIFFNLWFWENINFEKVVDDISFKEKFKKQLDIVLKMWVPFVILTKKWAYENFMNDKLEIETDIENKVKEQIKAILDTKNIEISDKIKRELGREATKEEINVVKEFTLWFMLGCKKGLWLNVPIDLSKFSDKVIASISIWIDEKGRIWVWVWASFSQEIERAILTWSIWVAPTWAWADISLSYDFSNEVSWNTLSASIGMWIAMAYNGMTYNIYHAGISEKSTSNVEGFNRIMSKTSEVYDIFIKKIESWEILSDEDIDDLYDWILSNEDKDKVKQNFGELMSQYFAFIKPINEDNKNLAKEKFKKAVLDSMANSLYTQVTWFEVTGLWAFVIPWVTQWIYGLWEYNWISHEVKQNMLNDALSTSMTKQNLSEFIETDKYIKNKVIIEWNSITIDKSLVNVYLENDKNIKIKNWKYIPETGYKLFVDISKRYSYNEDKDNSYIQYDANIRAMKLSWNETLVIEWLVIDSSLKSSLELASKDFDSKTRKLDWVKELITDWDLDSRWKWLEKLSKNIDSLKAVLFEYSWKNSKEKLYILTTISQYISIANDYWNWDIDKWNDKTTLEKYIKLDQGNRRVVFNQIMQSWLWANIGEEAKSYYEKLENWDGEIWKTNIPWVWFDIKATLHVWSKWESVRWALSLSWDINVLTKNWEVVKEVIKDFTLQENFAKRLSPEQLSLLWVKDSQELIDQLFSWEKELIFVKDSYGFDDIIMIQSSLSHKKVTKTMESDNISWETSIISDSINQLNKSVWLAAAWVCCKEENNKKDSTTPWEEEDPGDTTTPWEEETGNQWGWNTSGNDWTWTETWRN